jgi:hypothetical protein
MTLQTQQSTYPSEEVMKSKGQLCEKLASTNQPNEDTVRDVSQVERK